MRIAGPEIEQIAPERGIERRNADQAQGRRQRVGQARGEFDAPAALYQPGRVDHAGHVVAREQELLPGSLQGGRVAVIPVHHEHRILEVGRLSRFREEGAQRKVEVSHAVVRGQAVESVFREHGRVDSSELEAGVNTGDGEGPVIPRGLDKREKRLGLVAKHEVRLVEQHDVGHAPAVDLRRIVIALLENMQAGNIVREQSADIPPGGAASQKIIFLVALERVHQRVLVHDQRIARGGRGRVHVRNALEGYEKYYFLGGSATWGNIRGLFAHNIPGLHIFEEGDYDAPQVDGWGVSDVVLFDKAHLVLRDQTKPFFAFIQTAGNHRPFTIPGVHPGFELARVDAAVLAENRFDGLAAYNGMPYLAFSLGSFFAKAREAPYFRNTVFVMYGDHGNPSTLQTPWEQLLLTGYHVPCVIYAPGLVKGGRRIEFTASLPDSLPTALSLIGVPHLNTAPGRDLLDLGPGDRHFSLIGVTGVLDDEFYFRLDPGGPRLFRYRSEKGAEDVHQRYPEKVAELQRLQEALYETAKYMLYHNPPRAHAPEGAVIRQAAVR